VPRAADISICLIGSEEHKARPDLGDDSGFWLRLKAEDASHSFVKRLTVPAPCSRGTEASKVVLPGVPSKSERRLREFVDGDHYFDTFAFELSGLGFAFDDAWNVRQLSGCRGLRRKVGTFKE
jgi:hypothetical protein